jgi:WD40 repeat protein
MVIQRLCVFVLAAGIFVCGFHFHSDRAFGQDATAKKSIKIDPYDGFCLSPDGKLLAMCQEWGKDSLGVLVFLDLAEGKIKGPRIEAQERTYPSIQVAFSADSKAVAWGSGTSERGKGWVTVRDVASGKVRFSWTGLRENATAVAFMDKDKTLVTMGRRGNHVRFWDIESGEQTSSFPAHGESFAISPGAKNLALVPLYERGSREIQILHVQTGREMAKFDVFSPASAHMEFSPNGKMLAAYRSGSLFLWDAAAQEAESLSEEECKAYVIRPTAFSRDSRILASVHVGVIRFWDTDSKKESSVIRLKGTPKWLGFSSDGKTLYAVTENELQYWDVPQLGKGK